MIVLGIGTVARKNFARAPPTNKSDTYYSNSYPYIVSLLLCLLLDDRFLVVGWLTDRRNKGDERASINRSKRLITESPGTFQTLVSGKVYCWFRRKPESTLDRLLPVAIAICHR